MTTNPLQATSVVIHTI